MARVSSVDSNGAGARARATASSPSSRLFGHRGQQVAQRQDQFFVVHWRILRSELVPLDLFKGDAGGKPVNTRAGATYNFNAPFMSVDTVDASDPHDLRVLAKAMQDNFRTVVAQGVNGD